MLEIVLVDDAHEDLLLGERILRNECKLVNPMTLCKSGNDAISLIDRRHQEGRPFLMFLDMMMAPTSGLDVLQHWAKSKASTHSVIVMISGLTDMKTLHTGYQLGAKTFILKPIKKDDVVQVLNGLMDRLDVEEIPEGYALQWCTPGTPRGDTSLMRRGSVSFPA